MTSWTGRLASLTEKCNAAKARRDFIADQSGATYILVALSMTALLGMAGLGFDATLWYKDKRDIQTVADLAVLGSLHAMLEDGDADAIFDAADEQAERNGFVDGTNGTLSVNNPPLHGAHVGDANFVEVIVDLPRDLNFASFFLGDEINIQARAVAGTIGAGESCVLALDETADAALQFTGNTDVMSSCGMASNSVSDSAISVGGSAYVEVSSAQAFGDISGTLLESPGGGKGLYAAEPNQSMAVRLADPYADTEIPTDISCRYSGGNFQNKTLSPGVYCGTVSLKKAITLEAGVYIINGGDLSVNGGAFVTATGPVTFIFTADYASDIGGVNKINGGAVMMLSAPGPDGHEEGDYAGEYAGMLMIQDPRASESYISKMNGGATMVFSGAIYMPSTKIEFLGGADTAPGCLQVVARLIKFTGNSGFGNSPEACEAQGVTEISQKRARLIE